MGPDTTFEHNCAVHCWRGVVRVFLAEENNDFFLHYVAPACKNILHNADNIVFISDPQSCHKLFIQAARLSVCTTFIWIVTRALSSRLWLRRKKKREMDHSKAHFEMNEWSQQWDFHLSSVRQHDERGELRWFKVGSNPAAGSRSSLASPSVCVGGRSHVRRVFLLVLSSSHVSVRSN